MKVLVIFMACAAVAIAAVGVAVLIHDAREAAQVWEDAEYEKY